MKVAITGTIGSGKSTVLKELSDLGYPCLSADAINKELLEQRDVQKDIVNLLNSDSFSKENIRDVIFNNQDMKKKLEGYLHPLILNTINDCDLYKDGIQFVEVPLLFESGWNVHFDYSVVVYCDEDVARYRLVNFRGIDLEDVNQRIRNQMPTEEKITMADFSICNNDSAFILKELVKELLYTLREKLV